VKKSVIAMFFDNPLPINMRL